MGLPPQTNFKNNVSILLIMSVLGEGTDGVFRNSISTKLEAFDFMCEAISQCFPKDVLRESKILDSK